MRVISNIFLILLFFIFRSHAVNVVLVMADDQGWGQTGYYNHPVLKTPNLDQMAKNGLRFDRFYSGGPVCSPTRATVLTGRTHDRTGVLDHGYALRKQERTLSEAMKKAGYATAHFGKWHLNGLRGPGVPILKNDTHGPGQFGFEKWLSVTNFFDLNPTMSRDGNFEEFSGDSSEIIVTEALNFITDKSKSKVPFFTVIWYGTPHSPWMTLEKDRKLFEDLNEQSMHHYGELVAMDRSIGTLREGLRKLKIHEDTLVWFMSDNGGLPRINPTTTGGLRNYKGSLYEGGIRVPAIIECPKLIQKPKITKYPASASDIFPTIAKIVGLPESSMLKPQDGISLVPIFNKDLTRREKPIPFHSRGRSALIDNNLKIISSPKNTKGSKPFELYDLEKDHSESNDIAKTNPEAFMKMKSLLQDSNKSIEKSMTGKDYREGTVNENQPKRQFWTEVDEYKEFFNEWRKRPEYKSRLKNIK